jgi:hypothetical protein
MMQKKIEKNEVKVNVVEKECSDVRVFSTRPGAVGCPDGTLVEFKKSVIVSKEVAEWLFKSFPEFMMEIK